MTNIEVIINKRKIANMRLGFDGVATVILKLRQENEIEDITVDTCRYCVETEKYDQQSSLHLKAGDSVTFLIKD